MSGIGVFSPGRLGSLWEMLSFNVGTVLRAVTAIRQLESTVRNFNDNERTKITDPVAKTNCQVVVGTLDTLSEAIGGLNAKATGLAIKELRAHLVARKVKVTYKTLPDWISDIGVTLRRELQLMKTFCIQTTKEHYFESDFLTFGDNFKTGFASAVFEIDEAGKCHALGRSTATVFHLMRAMEIGVRAIARSLSIPDPVKPSERNWGKILETIKSSMDEKAKAKSWKGEDAALFADMYVSLDAIRVAWRNTTMHVENKYTDDEAEHIYVAVRGFMKRLSARMNQNGEPIA
jgi:hypothetical protein